MLDIMKAFRAIKPTGCVDDYVSGGSAIEEQGYTRKELGQSFNERILSILNLTKGMCAKQITAISGGSHAATARKLRILKADGVIKSELVRVGNNSKSTNFYTLVA